MSAVPGLADRAATLLEADPALMRVTGIRAAAAIGHRPLLGVLAVDAGPWTPAERERLGAGTVALTVLDGLLTTDGRLAGPGDTIEPWMPGSTWIACTPARLAVIGDAYVAALRAWPDALARLRARTGSGTRASSAGTVEERLSELLWRIALRWGEWTAFGLALPRELDLRALSLLLDLPAHELALALAVLRKRGAVVHQRDAWAVLDDGGPDGPHARRNALRARAATQLAAARAGRDDLFALCEQLDLELRRQRELQAAR